MIILTGEKGNIGSVLYSLYQKDGIDSCPIKKYEMDMNATRLIHLAAKSPPSNCHEFLESNIIYLKKIIETAINFKIKEFIFFSSISIYGNQNRYSLSEESPIIEPCSYGISKLFGEALLKESPM